MDGTVVKYNSNNYTFKPSYLNESLETSGNCYALNAAGSSFNKVTATTNVSAFRPYFTGPAASARMYAAKQIVFGGTNSELYDGPESALGGGLEIYVKDHKIITTNVGGISLANYVLKPGETVETPVQNAGVYIVNKKKVSIR